MMTRKEIVELGSTAVILVSVGVAYGRTSTRLNDVERRIELLEKAAQPGTRLADLCLELIQQQGHGGKTEQQAQQELREFGCYSRVAADTVSETNATGEAADLNSVETVPNASDAVQNR